MPEMEHGKPLPQKDYAGSRYFREFISKVRRDEDAGRYEHLEDFPYDILVDDELGLRLFHAGINPYDQEHFRHQLYIVVTPTGKASRLRRPGSVVASSLTLQWTKRADLCNALLLSVKSHGQCTFAWCGSGAGRSANRCGWCGHAMKTLLWRADDGKRGHEATARWRWVAYRSGRRLGEGEKHCCRWNAVVKKYECCRCNNPDNSFMTPLDREEAAALPQSVLPATLHPDGAADMALVPAGPSTLGHAHPSQQHGLPVVNYNFFGSNHFYLGAPGTEGALTLAAPAGLHVANFGRLEGSVPQALIDMPSRGRGGGDAGRVQEIEDDDKPAPKGRGEAKGVTKVAGGYVSPQVEDLDDEAPAPETAGVVEELSSLAIADKSQG